MVQYFPVITGSLTVNGNLSVTGTTTVSASNSVSSSYAYTASSAVSSSYAYTASSAVNSFSASKAMSSSYADTASFANNFTVLGNLTVFGTQSVQYITSSQLNVSDNVITVNVASPGVRFGGLSVFDSGSLSSEATASLFWDSQNNHWIYQRESGSTYTGGMLISGPRNAAGLGNELGTTSCMLLVGQGGDHLTSSMIYHDSARTCFPTAIIGASTACFASAVCAPLAVFPTSVVVGTTSLKSYSSLTSAGQIIALNNIGIDAGQSFRFNNYYNSGTVTDRTISTGYAASVGLDNSVGALTFNTSLTCISADNNVTVSERMRITNCGNIGINFPTPSFPLTRSGMTMKASTNDGVEFVMLSCADTGFIGGALVRNACDFGVINRTNGNLIFATNAQERLYITNSGIACFSCTICSGGSIVRKGFDSHTGGQWYKIPFYIDKNTPSGTATTKCLVVIDNNDAFQELHFTIEYGSRLQGFSDQYTQTSLRTYGVNRFNFGAITLNDVYLLTGGSGCSINNHAPMTVAVVGNCMSVVKVDFSSTLGNSSFVWGEVRIWSIESLTNKITISNNAY